MEWKRLWMKQSLMYPLIEFFYPNRCPVCMEILTSKQLLCDTCTETILQESDSFCPRCGKSPCSCNRFPPVYDFAVAACAYPGHGTAQAILHLKQADNLNFAYFAAGILSDRLQNTEYYGTIDCVMPVPMARSKQRKRGYNQAALIAREVSRLLHIPYREDVLYKLASQEQHTLTADKRQNNTMCYQISEKRVDGMRILLCDDVLTTGSTMNRCAMLLKQNGASAVIAAAAASTTKTKLEETT